MGPERRRDVYREQTSAHDSFADSTPSCDFFTQAWGRTSGGFDAGIRFLSDDAGALTKALGLELPTGAQLRTKRFSLIAEDGKVTHYFSSAKQSSDTWAPAVVSAL